MRPAAAAFGRTLMLGIRPSACAGSGGNPLFAALLRHRPTAPVLRSPHFSLLRSFQTLAGGARIAGRAAMGQAPWLPLQRRFARAARPRPPPKKATPVPPKPAVGAGSLSLKEIFMAPTPPLVRGALVGTVTGLMTPFYIIATIWRGASPSLFDTAHQPHPFAHTHSPKPTHTHHTPPTPICIAVRIKTTSRPGGELFASV